jgi:hypothetical protein
MWCKVETFGFVAASLVGAAVTMSAQDIPKEIWGKWTIRRILPTRTISCWGYPEAKKMLGTEIEYSARAFRWKDVVIKNPAVETKIVGADQYHDDLSGHGTGSSQIDFGQLGIKAASAQRITIEHPPANITDATTEIPGDDVLVKNPTTIIVSACNIYFEAKRAPIHGDAAK